MNRKFIDLAWHVVWYIQYSWHVLKWVGYGRETSKGFSWLGQKMVVRGTGKTKEEGVL